MPSAAPLAMTPGRFRSLREWQFSSLTSNGLESEGTISKNGLQEFLREHPISYPLLFKTRYNITYSDKGVKNGFFAT
jgi:hypothetical protein